MKKRPKVSGGKHQTRAKPRGGGVPKRAVGRREGLIGSRKIISQKGKAALMREKSKTRDSGQPRAIKKASKEPTKAKANTPAKESKTLPLARNKRSNEETPRILSLEERREALRGDGLNPDLIASYEELQLSIHKLALQMIFFEVFEGGANSERLYSLLSRRLLKGVQHLERSYSDKIISEWHKIGELRRKKKDGSKTNSSVYRVSCTEELLFAFREYFEGEKSVGFDWPFEAPPFPLRQMDDVTGRLDWQRWCEAYLTSHHEHQLLDLPIGTKFAKEGKQDDRSKDRKKYVSDLLMKPLEQIKALTHEYALRFDLKDEIQKSRIKAWVASGRWPASRP